MVVLGDVLKLQAKLQEKDGEKMDFHVAAVNQSGTEVSKGNVVFQTYT